MVLSPTTFTPCVENAGSTGNCDLGDGMRHPHIAQNILCTVNRRFLKARDGLRHVNAFVELPEASTSALPLRNVQQDTKEFCQRILDENYLHLWESRHLPHDSWRKEWLEVVLLHLQQLRRLYLGFNWLVAGEEAPIKPDDPVTRSSSCNNHNNGDDDSGSTPGARVECTPSLSSFSAPPPASSEPSPDSRHNVPRRSMRSWCLWEDQKRHLHHLSLRLHAWTPPGGGAQAKRHAMDLSTVARMDGSAFSWRVRQWCSLSSVLHHHAVPLVLHPYLAKLEEEEMREVLQLFITPSLSLAPDHDTDARLRQWCIGHALHYRMLVEVSLARIRAHPRCLFTWRLLVDVLTTLRESVISAEGIVPPATDQRAQYAALLSGMAQYLVDIVIPYLAHRDHHIESMQHTAVEVHYDSMRRAAPLLRVLYGSTTGLPVHCGGGSGVRSPSESVIAAAVASPAAPLLSLEERHRLGHAAVQAVWMGTAADLLFPSSTGEAVGRATPIATAVIQSVHHCILADSPEETEEEARVDCMAVERAVVDRVMDEQLLYSERRRRRALLRFFVHYFTQCPSSAFDKVHWTKDGCRSHCAKEEEEVRE